MEGRLADPARSLATDPRADPRMVAALAPFGLGDHAKPPPVTRDSPREARLEYCSAAEGGFQGLFVALLEGVPPIEGVQRETRTTGDVTLYIHRPDTADGPLPGIVHFHGGGMALLTGADPIYVRWRDALAAAGLVVVGVEFRNAGGALGAHPYPAGLQDCADGAQWAAAHRDDLGVSHLVLSGESGGGNLALATTLKAKREGWLDEIAGVYALCPYILGAWHAPPDELPSLRENDGYFVDLAIFGVLASLYDEDGSEDPLCWPLKATTDDLAGLPPHVISVNELDPLRDEGLTYYRRLLGAGVATVGRVVAGTCHGGDVLLPGAMPDVYAGTINDIAGFARSVG